LLKKLPIELPVQSFAISIVTLKDRTISPVARLFIETAREVAKPLATSPSASQPALPSAVPAGE
jgi:hypothetical protein